MASAADLTPDFIRPFSTTPATAPGIAPTPTPAAAPAKAPAPETASVSNIFPAPCPI